MKLDVQVVRSISKSDMRLVSFLKGAVMPVTEAQIIRYYRQYVAARRIRSGKPATVWSKENSRYEYVMTDYTEREIKTGALHWFDSALGRCIRKQILLVDKTLLLPQ